MKATNFSAIEADVPDQYRPPATHEIAELAVTTTNAVQSKLQEYVVPSADGAKAIFQWPVSLTTEDIEDLKDSLKILERKMTRPAKQAAEASE